MPFVYKDRYNELMEFKVDRGRLVEMYEPLACNQYKEIDVSDFFPYGIKTIRTETGYNNVPGVVSIDLVKAVTGVNDTQARQILIASRSKMILTCEDTRDLISVLVKNDGYVRSASFDPVKLCTRLFVGDDVVEKMISENGVSDERVTTLRIRLLLIHISNADEHKKFIDKRNAEYSKAAKSKSMKRKYEDSSESDDSDDSDDEKDAKRKKDVDTD
jgi:hypothetical protein